MLCSLVIHINRLSQPNTCLPGYNLCISLLSQISFYFDVDQAEQLCAQYQVFFRGAQAHFEEERNKFSLNCISQTLV